MRTKVAREPELVKLQGTHIDELFQPVLDNFKLSLMVFSSQDLDSARLLLSRKYKFRKIERRARELHQQQLGNDVRQSADQSTFIQDLVHDLKRINSHLVAVAYPILEKAGQLRKKRLRKNLPENSGDQMGKENITASELVKQSENT